MFVSAATASHVLPVSRLSSLVPSKAYKAIVGYSERFQILQERALLPGVEVRAPRVAGVAVGGLRRVEPRARRFHLHTVSEEPDARLIVDVVAPVEQLRPAIGRLQQIGERRHRSVVQVRRAQPQTVERDGDVALRLSEV